MKKFMSIILSVICILAGLTGSAAAQSAEPFPMEYWAVRDQISNVALSPNGEKLAFMKIASREGNPVVEIREVANLGAEPYVVGGKSMEITSFFWVSDNDLIVSFRDQVSSHIDGFNQGAYRGKVAHFNLRNKKFVDFSESSLRSTKQVQFVNALPDDPNHILVRIFDRTSKRQADTQTSWDYYRLDLRDQKKEIILRAEIPRSRCFDGYRGIQFDSKGKPIFAFKNNCNETTYFYRKPGADTWTEYYRLPDSSFESFSYAGRVKGSSDQIYVIAHNGHDRTGLWSFNLNTNQFEDLIYRDDTVDISRTFRHSNAWANPDEIAGVSYFKDKLHRKYFDTTEEQIMKRFEASIANASRVDITSRSRDGQLMIVRNFGPKDPGTYYLYQADSGKFMKIGSANGLLKPEGLSDVEYITYKSRDGKTIPAFITKPQGAGPHPLVVMPHGGPFVRESVYFDEWAQLLANNGYMVLQPQYRGSRGYGLDFYKTAFMAGGEGGKKMQDDKDDGVKYLISNGMVDADKVAFFGWSYGGYAALIAAARTPNLYKCSIAGAAVADNFQQLNYYRDFLDSERASDIEQIKFWTESINPIKEVENVNIPLLVIHGSIDQRVPVRHAKKYVDELKNKDKPYEYIKLKDADHFSNTLFYKHKMEFYPAMLEFLENDCGM